MLPNAKVKKENTLRNHVAKIETTHDVALPFYPNECFVCQSIDQVKRCSRCNMVSYCSSDHQKEHWPRHKEICNAIASIINEKGVSHIYENRDCFVCYVAKKRYEIVLLVPSQAFVKNTHAVPSTTKIASK